MYKVRNLSYLYKGSNKFDPFTQTFPPVLVQVPRFLYDIKPEAYTCPPFEWHWRMEPLYYHQSVVNTTQRVHQKSEPRSLKGGIDS